MSELRPAYGPSYKHPRTVPDESLIAEADFIDDYHYTEGFHGTDEQTGFDLVKNGFNTEYFRETFFAPPDNRRLATNHGKLNAERTGQERYALLKATFPVTPKSQPILGIPCMRFYGEDIKGITIVAVAIYRTADHALLATFDQYALEQLRQG